MYLHTLYLAYGEVIFGVILSLRPHYAMIERLGMNPIGSERSPYIEIHTNDIYICKIKKSSSFCRACLLSRSFLTCSALELEPCCADVVHAWTMIFASVARVRPWSNAA